MVQRTLLNLLRLLLGTGAPMVQRTLLNLLRLLLLGTRSTDGARTLLNLLRLLGTEHRWCEDPIESAPFY